ncbi:DNA primase [Acidisphaera sp. L21]|uniref:DNA primase n=1 Tax=Acidisphaera sp. L21 TaxID=1641851 RepID=UPI00131C1A17|nr:DNA primase [Acidisphaera sp. L21]
MALPPAFLDELRARTPMAALVGRKVKLARSGKSWKGCCPFHGEKSPSFYVYDDGYHCFGCGAHGDAIGFVMNTEGAGFIEAVERLAGEAGLDVPKPSPAAAEAERARLDLTGVLDLVAAAYTRRLHEPQGREALAYLRGRGLTDETIHRFGLGWSGDGRGSLTAELAHQDIPPACMAEAGLLQSRDDGTNRELFYNRVMFPIRDRRGRTISMGGRALGDAKPKYINGPETAVYSKSRNLYALDLAREGARKSEHGVIVAEGYMDVIALHQAGFGGAVAPLGTALTAAQLEELWRLSDAPTLCFDGDAAGARAAARAAEVALPLIAPDRTLCLVTLPDGEDPDTLVRRGGPAAFTAVLATKRPLAQALFEILREGFAADTPENRSALRARLDAAAARIGDKGLASEYRSALRDRFFESTRRRPGMRAGSKPAAPPPARVAPGEDQAIAERHRAMLAILINHPGLIGDVAEALSGLPLLPEYNGVRDALIRYYESEAALDFDGLMNHLALSGHAAQAHRVLATRPMPLPACAGPTAMPAEAEAGWWHFFGLLNRSRLEEEVAAAAAAFQRSPSPAAQTRLVALCAAREALAQDAMVDDAEA